MKLLFVDSLRIVMDYYLLLGSLTLLLQLSVFLLVVGGFLLKKRQMFRAHGFAMFAGLVLHLVTIGVIMVPSFVVALVPIIATSPFRDISLFSPVHVALGGTTAALGLWIVGSWRMRRSLQFCAPKRKWMRLTIWVWAFSLLSGFLLYLLLFWNLLFG